MDPILFLALIGVAVVAVVLWSGSAKRRREAESADAAAEARRWVERLGGQVYALDPGTDPAARQALADAGERFTAAGAQIDQARTVRQFQLAQHTAYEGLYYVRAARTALGLDPGPEIPAMPGQVEAGSVTQDRRTEVDGKVYEASPEPSEHTRHYHPGGLVAGKPVPRGWYSEPWWRPALVAGAWGVGTYLIAGSLFHGMAGVNTAAYADSGTVAGGDGYGDQAAWDDGSVGGWSDGGGGWSDGGGGWSDGGGGGWGDGGGGFDGGF